MHAQASKPIFIGGTGRCGTSILKRILSRHSEVFGLRMEARFIVDTDGLIDLADALSIRYSGDGSDKALRRFSDLMIRLRTLGLGYRMIRRLSKWLGTDLFQMVSPSEYAAYDVGRQLGLEHYDRTLSEFLDQIESYRFRGIWPGSRAYQFRPFVRHGRRFSRAEILDRCRRFAHDLYAHRLAEQGKKRWVEDTPKNMLRASQLYEMFPDMKLVHVFRDPRDVVASYVAQRWAPTDPMKTVRGITERIEAWLEIRRDLPDSSAVALRFEDFIAAPQETLGRLCDFLEMAFEPAMLEMDLSRHNIGRYRKDLTPEAIRYTEDSLSAWMQENGYASSASESVLATGAKA